MVLGSRENMFGEGGKIGMGGEERKAQIVLTLGATKGKKNNQKDDNRGYCN